MAATTKDEPLRKYFLLARAAHANSDPDNGDWDAEFITLRDASEAELMVRVGSINNVGFGF